jgi:hypothetical protein
MLSGMGLDPYYRFFPFKDPLAMISWNAAFGCDTYERLVERPDEIETATNVRNRHIARMSEDGITHSVLDALPTQIPYYCYLGYALGDYGIVPLGGRFRLRWYPVDNVQTFWERSPADSMSALETTISRIEEKYGVTLKKPRQASLP